MFTGIAVVFGGLWLVGVVTANTFGGYVHLLLVIAICAALIRFMQDEPSID